MSSGPSGYCCQYNCIIVINIIITILFLLVLYYYCCYCYHHFDCDYNLKLCYS